MAAVNLDRIDATLARLGEAAASQSTALMAMEDAPERVLIDPDRLAGTTAARATAALDTLTYAWACHQVLRDLVMRARSIRGDRNRLDARRTSELDILLHSPIPVPAPPQDIGAAAVRAVGGPAGPGPLSATPAGTMPPTVMICADDLVDRINAALLSARARIDEIATAWRTHLATVSSAELALATAGEIASRLGLDDDAGLAVAGRLVTELSQAAASDPLGVPETLPARVDAAVAAAHAGLSDLARRHDGLPQALRDATMLLERISALLEGANHDAERARGRIVPPPVPLLRLPDGVLDDERHGLRPWLRRLTVVASAGRWKDASRGLDRWREVAEATLVSARRAAEANAAPLRARDDLRGLLGGWQAKAATRAVLEEPDLTEAYRRARSALYTSPTDLAQAAALVAAFGAAVGRRCASGPPASPAPAVSARQELWTRGDRA